jgi:hypothetical protein
MVLARDYHRSMVEMITQNLRDLMGKKELFVHTVEQLIMQFSRNESLMDRVGSFLLENKMVSQFLSLNIARKLAPCRAPGAERLFWEIGAMNKDRIMAELNELALSPNKTIMPRLLEEVALYARKDRSLLLTLIRNAKVERADVAQAVSRALRGEPFPMVVKVMKEGGGFAECAVLNDDIYISSCSLPSEMQLNRGDEIESEVCMRYDGKHHRYSLVTACVTKINGEVLKP